MTISPTQGISKLSYSGISLNESSGGISELAESNLIAKYPLISTLLDSVSGASATFTRSTIKTFIKDDGTVDTAAIDNPAYTGSGILLEPESTNSNVYSYDISTYTLTRLSATTETITGPDGTTSAGEIEATATSANGAYCLQAAGITGTSQTIKFVCKPDTCRYILIQAYNNALTAGTGQYFNLDTAQVGAYGGGSGGWSVSSAYITAKDDRWLECTMNVISVGAILRLYLYANDAADSATSTAGQKLKYYNLSVQENDTSSIRTTTTALTRAIDVLSIPTTNWKNNDFAIYVKIKAATTEQESTTTLLLDFVDANNLIQLIYSPRTTQFSAEVVSGGTSVVAAVSEAILTTEMGCLITYKDGLVSLDVEGTQDTSTGAITNLTHAATCSVGSNGTGQSFNGVISYPKFINTSNITLAQAAAL